MAHFIATGTIATDLVRRETRNGVLTTFRLAAGQPGRGQVWIDIEAWGHLAGTVYHHGARDQHVIVAGRLTQKSWHDQATGQARHRLVVTAHDVDLLHEADWAPEPATTVTAAGVVEKHPTTRPAGDGNVSEFVIRSGRAGTKSGRLWLRIEVWSPAAPPSIRERQHIVVGGRLAYRSKATEAGTSGGHFLAASRLGATAPVDASSVAV